MLQFFHVLFYIQTKPDPTSWTPCFVVPFVSKFMVTTIRRRQRPILSLVQFILQVSQLMNKGISFSFLFSFLYGIKPYIMKHVIKGGILAFVVICLYAFVSIVAGAL